MYRIIFQFPEKIFIKLVLLVAVAVFFTSSPAAANDMDADSLLKKCGVVSDMVQGGMFDPSQTNNLMYCMGYFSGVIGVYNNTVMLDNFKTTPYCLPMGTNWKAIADRAVIFMREHPELLHQPAESIIAMALTESFPCRKQ